MCLAVPMKVIEINDNSALVELSGCIREARTDFVQGLIPGDFVLVHAGIAIEKIKPEEAEETLRLIRMMADGEFE